MRASSFTAIVAVAVLLFTGCNTDGAGSADTTSTTNGSDASTVDSAVASGDTVSSEIDAAAELDTTPQTATLTITTSPPGAEVALEDGVVLGTTPLTATVPAGKHTITASLDGFVLPDSPLELDLAPGIDYTLPLTLWPALGGRWRAFQCYWEDFPSQCWTSTLNQSPGTVTYLTDSSAPCGDDRFGYRLVLDHPVKFSNTSSLTNVLGTTTTFCVKELGPPLILEAAGLQARVENEGTLVRMAGANYGFLRLYRIRGADECTSSCQTGTCGPDGCGDACGGCDGCASTECGSACGGSCAPATNPNASSFCVDARCVCKPVQCQFKDCGDDGCGGSCGGSCSPGQECFNNLCQSCPHNCQAGQKTCSSGDAYSCYVTPGGCADFVLAEECVYGCANGVCSNTPPPPTTTCGVKSGWCPDIGRFECAGSCGYRCDYDYQTGVREWKKLGDCHQHSPDCTCAMYSTIPVCAHGGDLNNLCSASW